jgi:hypothetical protein
MDKLRILKGKLHVRQITGINVFGYRTYVGFVESEILTAVIMKSTIFWDITPWSSLKANRCFRMKCRLHLQGRTSMKQVASNVLLATRPTCDHEDRRDIFLRNVG